MGRVFLDAPHFCTLFFLLKVKKTSNSFVNSNKSRTFAVLFEKGKAERPVKSGCSTVGSILGLGPRGRTFESCHPDQQRALSSAGSERLPYKQRVGGSNPSAPTQGADGSLKTICQHSHKRKGERILSFFCTCLIKK